MKRVILGMGVMTLIIAACEEPQHQEGQVQSKELKLQKQTILADDYADSVRNWYFSQASPQQRYNYWYTKIQIDMNHMQLNTGQRAYVLEIFGQLSITDFQNQREPSKALTDWVTAWLVRAKDYQLSRNQMGQFVFSLSPAPLGPSVGLSYVDVCNCSSDSDWCDFLNGGTSSECTAHCDMKKSGGCGTMLLYSCDNDCTF